MDYGVSGAIAGDAGARDVLAGLRQQSTIRKQDVSALRTKEGIASLMSFDAAAALIDIERGPAEKCREWGDFLIEALLDFVVWGERPSGVVTDQQASWLLAQVGDTPTPACMTLLISVLEEAHTVPDWFTPAVRVRAINALSRLEAPEQTAA